MLKAEGGLGMIDIYQSSKGSKDRLTKKKESILLKVKKLKKLGLTK